ncbi:MAG: hypothetical protein IT182_04930 [Acidobacteria bacterium]|nr:hypothetical protein [Acidobacteriota bacterium]
MTTTCLFSELDDRTLIDVAKQLAIDERRATATLLRALVEVDARRLYLGEGCASLFVWCTQVLHLSEGGAYNRIEVARAARTYPIILDLVEQSAITLTTARLLAPHLTPENHARVLEETRHKSKREVEAMIAALHPKPAAPTVIRRVQERRVVEPSLAPAPDDASSAGRLPVTPDPHVPRIEFAAAPARIEPLAPQQYRIQCTLSRETHDTLRRAQALLRHAVPTGDVGEILGRALVLLVQDLERRRFAKTTRPREGTPTDSRSRHIPAAVRRTVWARDEGRCAFQGRHGRCRETARLEFHHLEPYAVGGAATADNIALRCRAHNAYEARLFFGQPAMSHVPQPSTPRAISAGPPSE